MKAIIVDHQEQGTNPTIQNASSNACGDYRAGSISPVYSIPDEDRTLTQIAEANPINGMVANEDVEIIDLSNIDDDDDSIHNDTNASNTDSAGSRITVEVDIHRGMSSLSLRDAVDPLEKTSIDVNYSQSILNNFEGNNVEQMQPNKMHAISQEAVVSGVMGNVANKGKTIQNDGNTAFGKIPNKNITIVTESNKSVESSTAPNKPTVSASTNTNRKNITVQNKEPLKEIYTDKNLIMSPNQKQNLNTNSSQVFYSATNEMPVTQRQTWYDSNRTCTVKDSNKITRPAQIFKVVNPVTIQNKTNFTVNTPNTFKSTRKENQPKKAIENSRAPFHNNSPFNNTQASVVPEIATTMKKKRGPRKKKAKDEKETKPKNKRVYRGPNSYKENIAVKETNKIIPIYNENVINDLSWIENIRYVREIKVDENDSKLNLEDSFWDNYYLPTNWSENEFI